MTDPIYITTTIPYVNARPHVGHALEFVQADVLARYYREQGHPVRFQTGTDDNSLKNVLAAQAEGIGVRALVDRNAAAFTDLASQLSLSVDDVISTSSDPRHAPGVERLWRACAASGDIYRKHYSGLYCVGCEQFYGLAELSAGRCPEHGTEPELVNEENWFFRLSRYAGQLREAITTGRLRIEPATRRNEVLGFISGGLEDFSVSRSSARAHGWGIPVPDDPDQVIYVWFDALGNYLTALGPCAVSRWWAPGGRQVQLLGKGVLRFHAVYWPAILLSAGLKLPTDLYVHDYLTVDGAKIGKSAGNAADLAALVTTCGTDALRWWLLRAVPRTGDTDFTVARLAALANDELANGIGNLVHRVGALIRKYRAGTALTGEAPLPLPWQRLNAARTEAGRVIAQALADFDFRVATGAVWAIAAEANRCISQARPWELAAAERDGGRDAGREFDAVLSALLATCLELADHLAVFLPGTAGRIRAQCSAPGGLLPPAVPVFSRLSLDSPA